MSSKSLTPHQVPLGKLPDPSGKSHHWYVPASDRTVHWGYFSKQLQPVVEIASGDYLTLECLTHQAGDDPARMIQGDPGCRERLSLDPRAEERAPPRRRTHGCRQRRRRRAGCAHPDRTGTRAGRCARRRARSAHRGDVSARLRQRGLPRQCFRYQSGGQLGLSLSRPAGGAEAARGRDHLRARCRRWQGLRTAALQLPLGSVHGSGRDRAPHLRLPGPGRRPGEILAAARRAQNVRVPIRPHFGVLGVAPAEADW